MGGWLDQAREDAREYINGTVDDEGGWTTPLTITPTGESTVVINGFATVHSQGFSEEGLPIITENSHVSFHEQDLNDLGVVTRDAKGHLIVKNWLVEFDHAIGHVKAQLKIQQPDSTLGLIVVTIGKYE